MPVLQPQTYFLLLFQGHFVKKLGAIGDKDTENEVLLLEHDIPHLSFSVAVLNALPEPQWSISDEVTTKNVLSFYLYSLIV